MRLLLDTHVLLWALADDPRLTAQHRTALDGAGEVFLSAVSIWEMTIKRALGKLTVPDTVLQVVAETGCRELPITWAHANAAGALPPYHGDPFDRLLIAQARVEGLTFLTVDGAFAAYDVALA